MREVTVKQATPQDTFDHMMGAGALGYSWWCDLHAVKAADINGNVYNEWEYLLTAETGRDDDSIKTATINHAVIMDAAKKVVVSHIGPPWATGSEKDGLRFMGDACISNCAALLFFPDEVDFDAASSDELLQYIVLGEIVFG